MCVCLCMSMLLLLIFGSRKVWFHFFWNLSSDITFRSFSFSFRILKKKKAWKATNAYQSTDKSSLVELKLCTHWCAWPVVCLNSEGSSVRADNNVSSLTPLTVKPGEHAVISYIATRVWCNDQVRAVEHALWWCHHVDLLLIQCQLAASVTATVMLTKARLGKRSLSGLYSGQESSDIITMENAGTGHPSPPRLFSLPSSRPVSSSISVPKRSDSNLFGRSRPTFVCVS